MSSSARKPDIDAQETAEWRDSLAAVIAHDGAERASFLLAALHEIAESSGVVAPPLQHASVNTIGLDAQPEFPGDAALEQTIEAHVRWNAMAMVSRANRRSAELGGHLSTFASAATLYEVGFQHFFRGPGSTGWDADMLMVQGHCAPGMYARSFLEGRFDADLLDRFRQEALAPGLSSYPHPWLMPDYWQFATVSMGLGPMMAIYQARFMKYLTHRELVDASARTVWAFLGDGEMDEPESMGALTVASRDALDNLVFVINCNLQRLDGPVRGNGSVVRELAGAFAGSGWNVIKVMWGAEWDPILEGPHGPAVARRMSEIVDGDYQNYAADPTGTQLREHFFGADPELTSLASSIDDALMAKLAIARGGHDRQKMYAAYAAAQAHEGQPTVILAHTIKGYGLGEAAQGKNPTHQQKKLPTDALLHYRDFLGLEIDDAEVDSLPYVTLPRAASAYAASQRAALGGSLPARNVTEETLPVPALDAFQTQIDGSGEREISSTMAFVRLLATLLREDGLKERIVPIVADEARTFGMEGLFRQIGIYAPFGQKYTPVDREQLAYYREDQQGQLLQEGISEAGAFCSWLAAATSYANHGRHMVPFYIYYSMFGFQRIGDFAWAAADMQARGFLLGATAGRTTLAGEGLQHQDGHSHLFASVIPNCRAYDPTYAYELAVLLHDGLDRMLVRNENVYYYLTMMNENYPHPAMPKGVEEGIRRGVYRLHSAKTPAVTLVGSGAILREVEAAATMLAEDHDVVADVFSATSYSELRREAIATRRWNRLNPTRKARASWVQEQLGTASHPLVAASDYIEAVPEQVRPFLDRPFHVLGTDGFGRSDTRENLRTFFEVDRRHVCVAALKALADEGVIPAKRVSAAIKKYDIDPATDDPATR